MLSKKQIIEKCFESNEDFTKDFYQNVINFFHEKDKNLSHLIVDKNMKVKNLFMAMNAIDKRINKLIKDFNLLDEFKIVYYKMYQCLETIINTIYFLNEENFDEHISEEKFIKKLQEVKIDENLKEKFLKKYKFKKLINLYNKETFSSDLRINFFLKDVILDELKLAKYYEKDKINDLVNQLKKIVYVIIDMFDKSGRKDFHIKESFKYILNFKEFLDK